MKVGKRSNRTCGHRVWFTVQTEESVRLRKLLKSSRQHPEWATENLERGPTPISDDWRGSL